MAGEKCQLLANARMLSDKSVRVWMTVALDVGEADHCGERQVLLDGKPCLRRQVLAGHESGRRILRGIPARAARRVQHRFVDALAILARHARVSQRTRTRERIER